jgi:hypothetical protein
MALSTEIVHAADSSLHQLDPILNTWKDVITRYGELWRWRDVPYWYNERASLGTFAAAVWLSGGVALEEYRTDKGEADVEPPVGASSKGRGDLYFHYGGAHFIVEAKQHRAYPSRSLDCTISETRRQLNRACSEVRTKRAYEDPTGTIQRRLGLAFSIPRFPAAARRTWGAQTDIWRQRILTEVPADCILWYNVPSGYLPADKKGKLYPGVCLLLRESL